MTTDLTMLVWTVVLAIGLPFVYLVGRLQTPGGLAWGLGNRDQPSPAVPAWAERAERAHRNLTENLAPFAALVLVAQVTGRADATTALGATLFFWARVGHAAVYAAGLVGVRTLVFSVGTLGELLILWRLLG